MSFLSCRSPAVVSALAATVGASLTPFGAFALSPQAQAPTDPMAPIDVAAKRCHFQDGSYQGGSFDAYYGNVQITVNVTGGCVASVTVDDAPRHRPRSRRITEEAMPMLESEVIDAQSGRIDLISGATLTAEAYIRSLRDALSQAANGK